MSGPEAKNRGYTLFYDNWRSPTKSKTTMNPREERRITDHGLIISFEHAWDDRVIDNHFSFYLPDDNNVSLEIAYTIGRRKYPLVPNSMIASLRYRNDMLEQVIFGKNTESSGNGEVRIFRLDRDNPKSVSENLLVPGGRFNYSKSFNTCALGEIISIAQRVHGSTRATQLRCPLQLDTLHYLQIASLPVSINSNTRVYGEFPWYELVYLGRGFLDFPNMQDRQHKQRDVLESSGIQLARPVTIPDDRLIKEETNIYHSH